MPDRRQPLPLPAFLPAEWRRSEKRRGGLAAVEAMGGVEVAEIEEEEWRVTVENVVAGAGGEAEPVAEG